MPLGGASTQPLNIRYVSAALSEAQSQQLLTAFYALCVARVRPVLAHACELILFRYMIEGGYTARWMGKYDQYALHVGNGEKLRRLADGKRELAQYRQHNLPAQVLNRLCGRDGRVHPRGSKGSRSKYDGPREAVRAQAPAEAQPGGGGAHGRAGDVTPLLEKKRARRREGRREEGGARRHVPSPVSRAPLLGRGTLSPWGGRSSRTRGPKAAAP